MRLTIANPMHRERAFCRIATAIAKYWLCKRSPMHVGEALECLGGNGYVEESIMPRLYREAPLYSIWEGSGNVMCLDVLRALAKDPATVEALMAEFKSTAGADPRLDKYVEGIGVRLNAAADDKYAARDLTEKLALALAGFFDGALQLSGDGGGVYRFAAGRAAWTCVWDAAGRSGCERNSQRCG